MKMQYLEETVVVIWHYTKTKQNTELKSFTMTRLQFRVNTKESLQQMTINNLKPTHVKAHLHCHGKCFSKTHLVTTLSIYTNYIPAEDISHGCAWFW